MTVNFAAFTGDRLNAGSDLCLADLTSKKQDAVGFGCALEWIGIKRKQLKKLSLNSSQVAVDVVTVTDACNSVCCVIASCFTPS